MIGEANSLMGRRGCSRKITWKAYMNLPKKHRFNKVQKYLKKYSSDGTPPKEVVPRIVQRARSYQLHENTSTCTKQEAVVTRYTGDPNTPYELTEMKVLGLSQENFWPGLTHKVGAEKKLDGHLVRQTDGMTHEEKEILDRGVVQTFDVQSTTTLKEKKKRLRQQGDMRDRPVRKAFTGGVVKGKGLREQTQNYE